MHAFDGLGTLVAVLRPDGAVVFANVALVQQLGASLRSIQGTEFSQYFSEPALLQTALAQVHGQGSASLRFEAQLRRVHGTPLPVYVQVCAGTEGDALMVELWPVGQQVRQERQERLWEQSQLTQELVRNLAHEVKNPLGGIRGVAQLLELELPSPQWKEYTAIILHEVDRLQVLVDRLLEPHRQPQQMGDVNIHEVCERVRALVLAEHPQGLDIVRNYDASIPEFRGDRAALVQALLNIVQNAAQALAGRMQEGDARIELRTRVARQVTVGRQRHRLALQLHVIDNGPGVPEALRERMFFPLVSGREGGSGLGLTLAHAMVLRHQGSIECDSRPGRTDFCICLPLH